MLALPLICPPRAMATRRGWQLKTQYALQLIERQRHIPITLALKVAPKRIILSHLYHLTCEKVKPALLCTGAAFRQPHLSSCIYGQLAEPN
jgi:hypothetical protein